MLQSLPILAFAWFVANGIRASRLGLIDAAKCRQVSDGFHFPGQECPGRPFCEISAGQGGAIWVHMGFDTFQGQMGTAQPRLLQHNAHPAVGNTKSACS